MIEIAVFPKYGNLAASTRQRFEAYRDHLIAEGITLELHPLLGNDYLERIYSGARDHPARILSRYIKRTAVILRQRSASALWVHCDVFPYAPPVFDRLIQLFKGPIIFDYDDAIFHNYDIHPNLLVRALLGRKIDKVMARSALVLAGNPYLAARAQAAGAGRVEIVPTVVDADAYDTTRLPDPDGRLRIGWIGSPGTWASYMQPVMPMLSEIARAHGARIRAVGANATATAELEVLPWSEADESRMIQSMDIGLMPLDDSPWSRGKCGYKIIQYMASGVPVIASPVGVNSQIVDHGVTGFLARTESEWHEALDTLLRDEGLRHRMGAAGRKRMEERYSLQVWGPRVAALLRSVAQS